MPNGTQGTALLVPAQMHPHRMRRVQTQREGGWCLTWRNEELEDKGHLPLYCSMVTPPISKTMLWNRTLLAFPPHWETKLGTLTKHFFLIAHLGTDSGTYTKKLFSLHLGIMKTLKNQGSTITTPTSLSPTHHWCPHHHYGHHSHSGSSLHLQCS